MPTAKLHALTILGALDEARSELVGKADRSALMERPGQ